jgi:hypothetical protein
VRGASSGTLNSKDIAAAQKKAVKSEPKAITKNAPNPSPMSMTVTSSPEM